MKPLELPVVSVEVAAVLCGQAYPTDVMALGQAAYLAAGGWQVVHHERPVAVGGLLVVATVYHPDSGERVGDIRLEAR